MDASIVFRLKSVTEGDDVTALRLVDAGRAQHGLEYLGLDVSRDEDALDRRESRRSQDSHVDLTDVHATMARSPVSSGNWITTTTLTR